MRPVMVLIWAVAAPTVAMAASADDAGFECLLEPLQVDARHCARCTSRASRGRTNLRA